MAAESHSFVLTTELPLPGSLDQSAIEALAQGWHGDPFSVLGPHRRDGGCVVTVAAQGALRVELTARRDGRLLGSLRRVHDAGVFAGVLAHAEAYRLRIDWPGAMQEIDDAYAFGPQLTETDLQMLAEGAHPDFAERLGAHPATADGVEGTRFAVWAPNARRVSVVGEFNTWDGRRLPMRLHPRAGIWELFVPGVTAGTLYKYEVLTQDGRRLQKADPVGRQTECPPATASLVPDERPFRWTDREWMARRGERQSPRAPMSIYEVHSGSWLRVLEEGARPLGWDELADRLVPYVVELGFTHIELMPVMEHPFYGSWGYQPLGLFAPTARHGRPQDFASFVDRCHDAGIGVILDWVPAHFPTDEYGLARFDGTALYEHEHPFEGYHHDWNTYIYNLGRKEVRNFLFASALEWVERYHVDGLRVDAVASMLYRDYSRRQGEWIPNVHGGRENLEAIAFLRDLNRLLAYRCPGAITLAEESTAFPQVSGALEHGGLGFNYKWNMGWMHDTLHYMQRDPIYRRYHHDALSFGLIYAFSERFVLPLSHDEVVYGKGSLINKMPGDEWQKFANLRAYFGFMWAHPGKKLLFMGGEIAQWREWNHDGSIDWDLLDRPMHRGVQRLVRDLNRLHVAEPALHARDAEPSGFEWLVVDDRENSVLAFVRRADSAPPIVAVCNFTPVPRYGYRIGLPAGGRWREIFNSDSAAYGGSNLGNGGGVEAEPWSCHGRPHSAALTLPPLSTLLLRPA